jgi:hypothetical protein
METIAERPLRIEERQANVESDRLVSVEKFAELCGGLSRWTIYSWLTQGKIKRCKVGRRTMLRLSELSKVIRDEA